MDSGTMNKWMGAILSALLVLFGLRTLTHELSHKGPPEKAGYEIAALVDETSSPAAPTEPAAPEAPIAELLKVADVAVGERVAKACVSCHSFEKGGANKVGPGLWDIVNRPAGQTAGFAYSEAMKAHGPWSYEALNAFLLNPKAAVKGTKMSYAGIKKAEDRAAVIAYLRNLSDAPAPLP